MNKNVRSVLCLLLCLATVLSFAACKPNETLDPTAEKASYTVRVVNQAGIALENVGVYVYEDSTQKELVWYESTDDKGEVRFTDWQRDTYVAVLADVPTGYTVEDYYPLTDLTTEICLAAGTMTGEEDITYQLGDMVMDFAFTATDGKEYTLKDLLENKQAVVLNFYFNGCQPCRNEFPYLQQAYEEYAHQVAVVAMNPVDSAEDVAAYQKEMELSFLMAAVRENWQNIMNVRAYPTTVVIDRFGNIVLMHTGSIDNAQTFRDIFAAVTGEDYEQKLYENITEIETTAQVGTAENPDFMGPSAKFEVTVGAGKEYHIEFLKLNKLTMQVKDPDAYVIYNGEKHTPKNGVVTLFVTCPDMNTPVTIIFGNSSDKEKTFTVTMASQPGTLDNPYSLKEGENTVKISAGNEQGVYYIWTAKENGTLRAWCTSATAGVQYDCTLYNLTSYAQRNLSGEGVTDEEGNRCVEVKVNKGDRVQMIAAVMPDESWNYPAGNFTYQVKFIPGNGRDEDKVEKTTYKITVVDEEEKPVSNVNFHTVVQEEAKLFVSNEEGIASVELPSDTYKVTMIVPDGYSAEVTEFELTKEAPEYTVKLEKKVIVMVDYTVIVTDVNDAPLANVTVIIGDQFANTDEQGKAVFHLEQGQYSAQISAPDGYVAEDSYDFAEEVTELTVVLEYTPGTQNNPIAIYELVTVTDPIAAGKGVYYNLFNMGGLVLTVEDADAAITIGENTYTPNEEGILAFVVPATGNVMQPVTMLLSNQGEAAKSFTVTVTYPLGHRMNPQELTALGQLETHLNEQYEDGYFYHWTAAEEGVVTFYVADATAGAVYDLSLTNTTNSANRTLSEDGEGGLVSLNVAAGDKVSIQVLTLDQYEGYPNADIAAVGSFTAQENTEDAKLTYSVIVKDGAGYPMPGVAVTIGTTALTTDENGLAFAQLVEGTYTATVTAPEDYYLTDNQFTLTPEAPQVEVMLEAIIFVDYRVNLLYNGSAYTGQVQVQILQSGVVVEEYSVTSGSVSTSLPLDHYTVKLSIADGQMGYDVASAVLTPDAPTLNLTLNKLVTNTDYTVTVLDASEKPMSGIMVQILEGTKTVAAVTTDASGVAAKTLPTANYTVKLTFSGTSYYYNTQTAVLTGVAPNLTIRLASEVNTAKYDTHWLVNDQKIYMLSEGTTHVQLGAGKPYAHIELDYTDCLFIFKPTRLGVYSIGVDVPGLTIRSYGTVVGNLLGTSNDFEDGTYHYEIKEKSQLGNLYLMFGVENKEGVTDACVTITRIGEPGFSMENLPVNQDWYSGYVPVKQSTPAGSVQYINIKSASGTYEVFYDETDKVYKVMVDGVAKTLYINLGTKTTQNISLNMVVNGDGVAGGSPLRKYFYDTNGNLIYKEEYTDIVRQYIDCADTNRGLYPLTKDLAYIIQNAKPGWWDVTSPDYILTDCNPEYGWLFAACYMK